MRDTLKTWYPLLLALLGAGLSAAVYPRLPESMVVHWDLQGNPNGWMPRPVGALILPVMLVVLWQLFRLAPRLDPRQANYARFGEAYETVVAATLLLVLATHCIMLGMALGYHLPVRRLVCALVGALYLVIGNVMPRTRSNWTFGVRTPWTLTSDRVWTRTHRLTGYSMMLAGIIMLAGAFVLPADIGVIVTVGACVAAALGPAAYSYVVWRREQRR